MNAKVIILFNGFITLKIPVINNSDQTPKLAPVKNTGDEGGQFIFIKKYFFDPIMKEPRQYVGVFCFDYICLLRSYDEKISLH